MRSECDVFHIATGNLQPATGNRQHLRLSLSGSAIAAVSIILHAIHADHPKWVRGVWPVAGRGCKGVGCGEDRTAGS